MRAVTASVMPRGAVGGWERQLVPFSSTLYNLTMAVVMIRMVRMRKDKQDHRDDQSIIVTLAMMMVIKQTGGKISDLKYAVKVE